MPNLQAAEASHQAASAKNVGDTNIRKCRPRAQGNFFYPSPQEITEVVSVQLCQRMEEYAYAKRSLSFRNMNFSFPQTPTSVVKFGAITAALLKSFFDVPNVIRVGTAARPSSALGSLLVPDQACTPQRFFAYHPEGWRY